jgi:hypothetical protein
MTRQIFAALAAALLAASCSAINPIDASQAPRAAREYQTGSSLPKRKYGDPIEAPVASSTRVE